MQNGPQGYRPLRDFIAAKIHQVAGLSSSADQVLVTSGSLQAIDLVNAILVEPGDTVIVEAATYAGSPARLKRCGAKWVGIDVDDDGLRTDELERTLESLRQRGIRPKCQRRSKSTPLAGVKMHHLMRFSPALAVVPVVHRRDPRCFV